MYIHVDHPLKYKTTIIHNIYDMTFKNLDFQVL